MATSKPGTAFREMHKQLEKLHARLNKIKEKIPVKERDPRIEKVSFHLRAAGVNLATQF